MEAPTFIIEKLQEHHWTQVEEIYLEGISNRMATFETRSPGWELWNETHHPECRYVITDNDEVRGWAALSPVSKRKAYAGVAEVSIYIHKSYRGFGFGKKLLEFLIDKSEKNGFWTLQVSLFPENKISFALHTSCGFREIGIREKIAQLDGIWRNTVLLERRSRLPKFD